MSLAELNPTFPDGYLSYPTHRFPSKSTSVIIRDANTYHGRPLCIVMVGLPSSGKSYTARKLCRYLNWLGVQSAVFSSSHWRKTLFGNGKEHFPAEYFDPTNKEAMAQRVKCVEKTLECFKDFIEKGGKVGIIDSQNVTKERRDWIFNQLREILDPERILFLEVVVREKELSSLITNKSLQTVLSYLEMDVSELEKDFKRRMELYQSQYQPIDESEGRLYLSIIDNGNRYVACGIRGYLKCKIMNYLMHLCISFAPIYCTRHGESLFNTEDRVGGDSGLSEKGIQYSKKLCSFIRELPGPLEIWTSSLIRTQQTVQCLAEEGYKIMHWKALDEIDAGVCDSMTYKEIEDKYPEDAALRKKDKYNYRYPQGESYHDLVTRILPVVLEIERCRRPLVIVGHQAILRALFAYLLGLSAESCPYTEVPLNSVFEFRPTGTGTMDVIQHKLL